MSEMSTAANNVNWLVANFVERNHGNVGAMRCQPGVFATARQTSDDGRVTRKILVRNVVQVWLALPKKGEPSVCGLKGVRLVKTAELLRL